MIYADYFDFDDADVGLLYPVRAQEDPGCMAHEEHRHWRHGRKILNQLKSRSFKSSWSSQRENYDTDDNL